MTGQPLLSLVVPSYNEAENIISFLESTRRALHAIPHEILVVDDDSPDGTWRIVEAFSQTHPGVVVLRRQGQRGLSSAVMEGFKAARGEVLGVIDADLSHDETRLPSLLQAIQDGAELAVGSRRLPGGGATDWPWHRRWSSHLATFLVRVLLDVRLSDPMSGYFLLRRSFYERCKHRLVPTGYKILLEIACKGSPKSIREVPFVFRNRRQGHSKLSVWVISQYGLMLTMLISDQWIQELRRRYHTGRYRKMAAWLLPGDVLDIGCGRPCETMPDGAFLRFIGRGTGVDIAPCDVPFPFFQTSLLQLPFPDKSYDTIVAMEVLEHVTESERALAELSRVLKDEGRLLVSVPHETWLWEKIWSIWEKTFGFMWAATHEGTMHWKEWEQAIARYFIVEEIRRHWRYDLLFRLKKRVSR